MEPDGLVPSGTFVEFTWHSFETDGDLDGFPYPYETTDPFAATGNGPAPGEDTNSEPDLRGE